MANPKGNPKNLKPFKKGQSGNPGGQGKGPSLTSLLKQFKDTKKRVKVDGKQKILTYGELLVLKMWEQAIKGNTKSQEYICDRLDGKPIAKHELEGKLEALGNIKVYLDGKDSE